MRRGREVRMGLNIGIRVDKWNTVEKRNAIR